MHPRKIRIAHVLFRLDYGGLENGVVNIIRRLPSQEFDHTIISLTDSTDFRQRLPDHVSIVEVNKRPGPGLAYLYKVWKMLRSGRFDILHTRNLPCLETQAAGLLAGVPVRIHGEHGWDIFDLRGKNLRYRLLRRVFAPFVHRFVVLSRHLQAYLTEIVAIAPERVVRICNGVDIELFHPAAPPPPTGDFVVGSVGRLEVVKDFMTLAQAFALFAAASHPPSRLVLIGDGSQRAAIAQFIAARGLSSRCEIAGARDDVAARMRGFSVFVLSSRAEGISNTILEAMASGLPVIATDVGGNAELVVDGETGFLVPAGDPAAIADRLAYYSDHPDVLARHGRAGRERAVREFSIEIMVGSYRRLYLDSMVNVMQAAEAA